MKIKYFNPQTELQPIIKYYWLLEAEAGELVNEQQFFPLGAIEIILHLKNPFFRGEAGSWIQEDNFFIEGQQKGILKVKQKGDMRTVGITLYPWATCFLFNTSPQVFTNSRFPISDVSHPMDQLTELLMNLKDDDSIPLVCDRYFLSLIKNKRDKFKNADHAIINLFKRSEPGYKVENLKIGWSFSSRFFEKKFIELIGISAGGLMKKRRMSKALTMMLSGNHNSLTDIAHTAGFFDQSHFTKDFRSYFGCKPSHLLKENQALLKNFI